jgi:predicted neuraminidase
MPTFLRTFVLAVCAVASVSSEQAVLFEDALIFQPQEQHVHGSSVVELPDGGLLACWFQGSGERWADDVVIMGARKPRGASRWSTPFVMVDTPGFPDINPTLFLDDRGALWLTWYAVLANQWESSLLMYATSDDFAGDGPPLWKTQRTLLVRHATTERGIQPGDPFVAAVESKAREYVSRLPSVAGTGPGPAEAWIARVVARARGEDMVRDGRIYADPDRGDAGGYKEAPLGYPLSRRLGWQTQNKPIVLPGGRIVLPLYSDGFSFSIMAITDDRGATWRFSEPIVGMGNIQPAIAVRKDGTLVAYMRDNGPAPKRLHVSESSDRGETWSAVRDSSLPNPGTGADILTTRDGTWVLAFNDIEQDRTSLAVAISADEGRTWPWIRHVERDERAETVATRSHYPALVQGADGTFHLVYSFHHNDRPTAVAKTIKYVHFNQAWVTAR